MIVCFAFAFANAAQVLILIGIIRFQINGCVLRINKKKPTHCNTWEHPLLSHG